MFYYIYYLFQKKICKDTTFFYNGKKTSFYKNYIKRLRRRFKMNLKKIIPNFKFIFGNDIEMKWILKIKF